MGIDLPKILAVLPAGVIRRASSKTPLILLNDDSNQSHQINLDEYNEYTFSSEAFCFNKPSQRAFFDGTQKILEYVYDGQNLSIQIFTTNQTNLFIDVNVDECDIRAVGPVCIQGNFNILSRYDIAAKALSLDGVLICKDNLSLNVGEDLSIFGEFNAPNLRIRAGVYHQSAKMVVEQFDIVAQVFCQTEGAVFKAASIRMIAEISRISGQFEISDHCFSAVSHWIFGEDGSQSIIHFPASHHVHVGALSIKDGAQVVIGEPSSDAKHSQWVVDDDIEIEATSSLVVHHGRIFCHKMDCSGVMEICDSVVFVKTLIERGTVTLLRSQLNTKSIHLEMGLLSVQHSGVSARKLHAMAGHVLVQDGSALSVSDRFIADKATVKITDSDISVKQKVVLQGRSKIRASIVKTDALSLSDKVSIKKSHILAKVVLLQDTVCVEQSNFKAKDVSFVGQLELDNVQIDTNNIEYQSSNARLRRNFVKAKRIVLEGGTKSKQCIFQSSRLMAKSFTVLEAVDIQDSTMIGIDDAKANHSIQGHLFLRNSRWITYSRVRSLVGSHIHPCVYSEIIAGKITASGDISVDESLVQCEGLSLIGSNAILRGGEVIAENAVHIHRSELTAHTDSSIVAESVHLSGQSHVRLKKSNLHLSGQLTISYDSALDINQSKISADEVRFLGGVALVRSLLSAEELIIYDDFLVQQSMVHAKEDIVLAGTAKARMGDSTLHARNIESFGNVGLESTQLHAREQAALWTDSKISMAGSSVVNGCDVVIRGEVITQKKKQKPSQKDASKPTFIASQYLDISPKATIRGDEDLTMSADIITQSGQIDLQASCSAEGRRLFDNLGVFQADSIYLGFDDAVVNHSSISAKNITIHSNLMNILGRIYAEQSMTSSGFVSLNMGLIAANNYMNDSLVSMNLGIMAPNVLADPRFIFSWNNLISTARTMAMMWAPAHTSGIQLAFMLPGFYKNSKQLYKKTEGFTRVFDLKRHEYMPILCQMKSLALLGQGMYTSGNLIYNQEYVNWQTSFNKLYNNSNDFGQDFYQAFHNTNWQEFGINSAEAFAGSYTDTSLIHANLGVSLGANTFKTNLLHVNLGEERSLFTHNIATNRLYNRGQSTGGKSSFTATTIQNQGTLLGTQQFSLRSKMVDNTSQGHIRGTHASVDIEKLNQSGEFVAEEGRIHIGTFQDRNDASTTMRQVVLEGDTLDSSGYLDLSHSAVHEKEYFITSTRSQFVSDDVSIETGVFHGKGQLDYQHHLSIQASTAILDEGSIVNGQRTDKDKLFVPGKDGAQSEFKPEHVLVIEAEKVDLGGRLDGGDYTQIQGRRASTDSTESTKSEELIVRNTADIDLTHGSIKSKQAVISGKTSLDGFDIDIDTAMIEQEKGSLLLDNAQYKGHSLQTKGIFQFDQSALILDELEQHGEMHGMHSNMKVDTISDDAHANTSLEEVTLEGKRLDLIGSAQLSRVHIQEDEYVHAADGSKLKTDEVEIEAGDFTEKGALDYAHHLTIKAKKATLAKGSVVSGQKTADEQLFTQPSENDSEAKPILNPQHILVIEAPKVALDGSMSGGDYTEIHGEVSTDGKEIGQCDTLAIANSASIDLKHGRISTQFLQNHGKTSLDDFGIEAGVTDIGKDSTFTLSHSVFKGKTLHEEGSFNLHDAQAQIDEIDIHPDAHPELIDSYLVGHSVKDASHLSFGGDSGVIADDYQHSGYYVQLTLDGKSSTFSVKAKTANLQGGGDLDNAVFQIDHFANAAQFIAGVGAYLNYRFHLSLGLSTLDDLTLTNPIYRDCDIAVQAAIIDSQFDYNKAYQLSFISTVGDITFARTLQGSNVYAYSARDILNRGLVLGTDKVFFQAGRNVENRGKIASGKYTQILAKSNVTNLCEEEVYQGQWDTRRNYKAAVIAGGTGEDTDGIGLHIEADGEVISDASDFMSQGSNYIQGKRGVHFNERHHVYLAFREEHKVHQSNFWKKCKDVVAKEYVYSYGTGTDLGISHAVSGNGRNIIVSGEGEVTSVAAQFISPNGTDVYARGDVRLYGLRVNNDVHQTHTDWWGLRRDQRTQFYDFAQPTLFVDNGATRIHSSEGNVDARGAYFIGGGDLEIRAKKQIFLGVDILDHQITERSQSFGWSMPGKGAWDTYRQGGKIWDIGAALDPSLGKANAVYQSKSGTERLASAANLGIDLANTGNSLMRGIAQSNITDELLARYGLGHDGQFAPSISLSLTQRKTKTCFQTQAQGGIDRGGNVTLEAGEGIELENGVRVHTGRDLDINAPKIRAHGAKLQSSMQHTTVSETVGIVGLDGVESFGVSISQTKTYSTSIINAELSAGSDIHVHNNGGEIEVLELDGANMHGQSISGKTRTLIIRDQQNTSQTQTKSVSAATNGMFSGYKGKGYSRTTQQHSGIHTVDSMNANGHEFSAHETHMIGGKITTDGENHFETDKLTTETLVDVEQYSGFGLSGNLHDVDRLLDGRSSNRASEPMFSTATIQLDKRDFIAVQKSVIHGRQSTELSVQALEGQLETQRDSGRVIEKDHSLHVQIDIPVTNHEFLAQAIDNVHGAEVTLSALFHPKSQELMASGKPEPIVPVEDMNVSAALLAHLHRRRRKSASSGADESMEESDTRLDTSGLLFSTNDTEVMHLTVTKAQHEYRATGKLSDITKHELKKQVTAATTKMVKAYGSAIFDEMAQAAELSHSDRASLSGISAKGQVKSGQHFRKLDVLWKLWMNEELALLDDEVPKADKFKHGIILTAMEYGLDFAIEHVFKEMAGPMGVALTLIDISDSFYDEDVNKMNFNQGLSELSEAHTQYRDGNGFRGWLLEREAIEQMNAASRARASHDIADFLNTGAKKVASGLNSFFQRDKQKPSSRDDLSIHIDTTHNIQSHVARARSGSI